LAFLNPKQLLINPDHQARQLCVIHQEQRHASLVQSANVVVATSVGFYTAGNHPPAAGSDHECHDMNANLAADNNQGENALHKLKLAQNGFFGQVSALLPHKPALVDQPKAGGITMLHMASQGNFVELVQVLQSNGADMEKADWQVKPQA